MSINLYDDAENCSSAYLSVVSPTGNCLIFRKGLQRTRHQGQQLSAPRAIRNNPGQMVLPGGSSTGLTGSNLALHEFLEETGVNVSPYMLAYRSVFYETRGFNAHIGFALVSDKNLNALRLRINQNLGAGTTIDDELVSAQISSFGQAYTQFTTPRDISDLPGRAAVLASLLSLRTMPTNIVASLASRRGAYAEAMDIMPTILPSLIASHQDNLNDQQEAAIDIKLQNEEKLVKRATMRLR